MTPAAIPRILRREAPLPRDVVFCLWLIALLLAGMLGFALGADHSPHTHARVIDGPADVRLREADDPPCL